MCVTTVIWDSSCVGYDIWDRQLECEVFIILYLYKASSCVDRLNTEGNRDSASWLMRGNSIWCFSKMSQVRTVHDKPGCIQT